jgi:hypothetical protein
MEGGEPAPGPLLDPVDLRSGAGDLSGAADDRGQPSWHAAADKHVEETGREQADSGQLEAVTGTQGLLFTPARRSLVRWTAFWGEALEGRVGRDCGSAAYRIPAERRPVCWDPSHSNTLTGVRWRAEGPSIGSPMSASSC